MGLSFRVVSGLLLAGAAIGACAQGNTAISVAPKLLPDAFGGWQQRVVSDAPRSSFSLSSVSQQALEESQPERSQVADYVLNSNGNFRTLHVEAIQFGDRTGAYSAYTLAKRPDMREGKDIGSFDSVGTQDVLFTQGSSLVLAYPATAADFPSLKQLAEALPKVSGNKGIAPLLPTFVPEKGLVNGSVRYALGAATYAAQGGVLPANSIGWNKSAEAITAAYADKRGKETLTLLIYPTPDIARAHAAAIRSAVPSMGSSFVNAQVRQELELVMLANGSFAPEAAQKMVENIHMRQQVSFDKDMPVEFHAEVQKTASLLFNIAALFGILATAAVLLGLFLGGGRAMIRVMRGKPAAVEPEFLSLHLDPENKPVHY